ncbi:hypothetical protein J7K18_02495 [bacterium]|nr:hypothetical protein [bacterium]
MKRNWLPYISLVLIMLGLFTYSFLHCAAALYITIAFYLGAFASSIIALVYNKKGVKLDYLGWIMTIVGFLPVVFGAIILTFILMRE